MGSAATSEAEGAAEPFSSFSNQAMNEDMENSASLPDWASRYLERVLMLYFLSPVSGAAVEEGAAAEVAASVAVGLATADVAAADVAGGAEGAALVAGAEAPPVAVAIPLISPKVRSWGSTLVPRS